MDEIDIRFDIDDIGGKSADEKLTLLLKIAFANHKALRSHEKVLFGNGERGLCDKSRFHGWALGTLWSLFLLVSSGIVTMFFMHISGK